MAKPKLSAALNWAKFEKAVLAVFVEALRLLAEYDHLPEAEEPLNLLLFWLALKVRYELEQAKKPTMPFCIIYDSTNQPEPDDSARSRRMKKRPDFACLMTDSQAESHLKYQVKFYLECKRLGTAQHAWVFNENYSMHGIHRFTHNDWQYGKGCPTACMVGYMQNMKPADVLTEVNAHATARQFPSLALAAAGWAARKASRLSQPPLTRAFEATQIQLTHLWVDLRHCTFDVSSDQPPESAKLPTPPTPAPAVKAKSKKSTGKKQKQ